ncbi:MAG: hypothetical protein PUC06_02875 [Oscillospiraceae bacterium]|nr:hypothetical protein [Oscillospiraceae bacterium]
MDEIKIKEGIFPAPPTGDAGELPPMNAGGPPGREPIILPELDWDNLTLHWAQYQDKWTLSEDGTYYALKFVYYATKLLSRDHQYMNIYVPAAYLSPDGTVNPVGACGGYTARTAPVVMYNNCGGWMSSIPGDVNPDYIRAGFVHVNVGARSRDLGAVGKGPAACVDQKAAVRMLRLNDEMIPGDKNRIISCGGSGGGQMSSILGATGNMADYYPFLEEIGAAGIEKLPDGTYSSTIPDHIYASQCFCPIADINNSDIAYAWQRFDDPNIRFSGFAIVGEKELTPFQLALQKDLAAAYAPYINSLELCSEDGVPLRLGEDLRSGSYYEQMLRNISDALNAWLKDKTAPDGSLTYEQAIGFEGKETHSFPSADAYFASLKDTERWLVKEEGGYRVTSLPGFIQGTALPRGKAVPGFDTFYCQAENNAFGQPEEAGVHFSESVGSILEKNKARYEPLAGAEECDMDAYIAHSKREDLKKQVYLYNATHILLDNAAGKVKSDFAKFWRTRNGTADEHTSFAIAYNLCMAAKKAGAEVDYSLIWNAPHGDVDGDGTGTFVQWVQNICN